ncbi:hypothetical protein HHK36_004216 [Tetracentron sinense]|uniref:Uncharacterized protein n=1 Tax=Tetracentron sinense TaxID=13715 RepID=A0A835DP94_TETSI|nr:hypothetical protein HHK36_004216 [Tetracentron sinense]
MALHCLLPSSPSSFKSFSPRHLVPTRTVYSARRVQFLASAGIQHSEVPRRSANFKPTIWDNDYLQSLKSDYLGETYLRRSEGLKDYVRHRLDASAEPLSVLELIDTLQRLGVGYHFENEIKGALNTIISMKDTNMLVEDDLYVTALNFRLFRQHGYEVSQDVFKSFKDKKDGGFKAYISEDIKGMLSMYEASYYAVEGEDLLNEAQEFTTRHLKELIKGNIYIDPHLVKQVNHALELPLHWRFSWLEARWFIDTYKMKIDTDPLLLELAKLDFNMVQATHQQELKDVSRWWNSLGLGKTLSFARDRLVENFYWAAGFIFEPKYGYCRKSITKLICLITPIDDVYDVYGSLDELKLFTDAVERWDINTVQDLPDYMKICFLALYNTTNEMAYDVLREHGQDIIQYLKKVWTDLCKAYLAEATWYYNGYTPTLEEYINNALISVSGPLIQVHAYFLLGGKITKEAIEYLMGYQNLIRWSSVTFRLADDLGTATDEIKRGDVPKSIQCYMHESGVSEEIAREHINHLIAEMWKKMNKDMVSSHFPLHFTSLGVNTARTAQCFYLYGDGYGIPDRETKEQVLSMWIEPIPLMEG